jgi:hypothetical protein
MNNNQFRRPLLQSAAILAGVIVLAAIAASSGDSNSGGFLGVIVGIGQTILFVFGLVVGVGVCIATLIGIFLAAVAMVSPQQASEIYTDLKGKFAAMRTER